MNNVVAKGSKVRPPIYAIVHAVMLSSSTKDTALCKRRDLGFALGVRWILTWFPGIIHICTYTL